ncbi:hypothetical protein UlMin_018432 [Ulmus minor]
MTDRKESPWVKYFDHNGGRVTAVEAADEWSVDMSKLFLGLRFAHGAHSRLYHGVYNKKNVVVKIICCLEDDDSEVLAARLEKQFTREVTFLSRLHHQNVIKLKITDFGIACDDAYCDSLADDPRTYQWMAPEMIKKKSYGRKVDVYSFSLILWEMVAGTIPYEDMNPIQAAFAVVNKSNLGLCNQIKGQSFWKVVEVLEQFETSLARDETLNLLQNPTCQDHKKGFLHWIQKLGPTHPTSSSPVPKP